jgi:hypothetical protein
MTPLERAQRAVAQWDYHWAISAGSIRLIANIKREIEEAIESALHEEELQQRDEHATTDWEDL